MAMVRFTQTDGECFVFTFKDGLLSPVAHDLKLRVGRWQIDADAGAGKVSATFEPTSLAIECVMKDGREAPGTLSSGDKAKIVKNIGKDVLETKRHRQITFESSSVEADGDGYVVAGELTLHGRSRRIEARVRRDGDRYVTRVRLHQPDFGIKPFTAMLGTLKVKPDVEVEVRVPAS